MQRIWIIREAYWDYTDREFQKVRSLGVRELREKEFRELIWDYHEVSTQTKLKLPEVVKMFNQWMSDISRSGALIFNHNLSSILLLNEYDFPKGKRNH